MASPTPLLAVREATAARMLDMTLKDFRHLVQIGALPAPVDLPGKILRWRVSDLKAILSRNLTEDEFET